MCTGTVAVDFISIVVSCSNHTVLYHDRVLQDAWALSSLEGIASSLAYMYGPRSSGLLNEGESKETSHKVDEMEKRSKEIAVTWIPSPNPHIEMWEQNMVGHVNT